MKAITTRYHGPTNTKAARIIASDMDGNNYQSSVNDLSAAHTGEYEQHRAAANRLAAKMNWTGTLKGGYVKGGLVWRRLRKRDNRTHATCAESNPSQPF